MKEYCERSTTSVQDQQFLLKLARDAITAALTGEDTEIGDVPVVLQRKLATFVTLTEQGELRGCIGSLTPTRPLYKDVIENALSAAFHDPRFAAVTRDDLEKIRIEISILTLPAKQEFKDPQELITFLDTEHPGLILKSVYHQATFLPQVWEQLPKAEEFLGHLCQKAGLHPDAWQRSFSAMEFQTYHVEKFSEG